MSMDIISGRLGPASVDEMEGQTIKTMDDIKDVLAGAGLFRYNDEKLMRQIIKQILQGYKIILKALEANEVSDKQIILNWTRMYMDYYHKISSQNGKVKNVYSKSLLPAITYIIGCCVYESELLRGYQKQMLVMLSQILEQAPAEAFVKLDQHAATVAALWCVLGKCKDYMTQALVLMCVSKILSRFAKTSPFCEKFFEIIRVDSFLGFSSYLKYLLWAKSSTKPNQYYREFLNFYNKLNASPPSVYSFHCESLYFGGTLEIHPPNDVAGLWVDLNYGPKTLSFDGSVKKHYDIKNLSCTVASISKIELNANILTVSFDSPAEFSDPDFAQSVMGTPNILKLLLSNKVAESFKASPEITSSFSNEFQHALPSTEADTGKKDDKALKNPSEISGDSTKTNDDTMADESRESNPPEEAEMPTDNGKPPINDGFKVPSLSAYRNAVDKIQESSKKTKYVEKIAPDTPSVSESCEKRATSKGRRFFKNIIPGEVSKSDVPPPIATKKRGRKRQQKPKQESPAPPPKRRQRKVSIVEPLWNSSDDSVASERKSPSSFNENQEAPSRQTKAQPANDGITIDLTDDKENIPQMAAADAYNPDYESDVAGGQSYRNYRGTHVLRQKNTAVRASQGNQRRVSLKKGKRTPFLDEVFIVLDDDELPTTSKAARLRQCADDAPVVILPDDNLPKVSRAAKRKPANVNTSNVQATKASSSTKRPRLTRDNYIDGKDGLDDFDSLIEEVKLERESPTKYSNQATKELVDIEELWAHNTPTVANADLLKADVNPQNTVLKLEKVFEQNDELFQQLSKDRDEFWNEKLNIESLILHLESQGSDSNVNNTGLNTDATKLNAEDTEPHSAVQEDCVLYRERSDDENSGDEDESCNMNSDATNTHSSDESSEFNAAKATLQSIVKNVETEVSKTTNIELTSAIGIAESPGSKFMPIRQTIERTTTTRQLGVSVITMVAHHGEQQRDNLLPASKRQPEVSQHFNRSTQTRIHDNPKFQHTAQEENANQANAMETSPQHTTGDCNASKAAKAPTAEYKEKPNTSGKDPSPDLFVDASLSSSADSVVAPLAIVPKQLRTSLRNSVEFLTRSAPFDASSFAKPLFLAKTTKQQHTAYNEVATTNEVITKQTTTIATTAPMKSLSDKFERQIALKAKDLVSECQQLDSQEKIKQMTANFKELLKCAHKAYETCGNQWIMALKQAQEQEAVMNKIINDFASFQQEFLEETRYFQNNRKWNAELCEEYKKLQEALDASAKALRVNQWHKYLQQRAKDFMKDLQLVSDI